MHPAGDDIAQGLRGQPHVAWRKLGTRRIDHRVPRTLSSKPVEIRHLRTITPDRTHLRHIPTGPATTERRHVPATAQRSFDDALAQEPCATQDQNPHGQDPDFPPDRGGEGCQLARGRQECP